MRVKARAALPNDGGRLRANTFGRGRVILREEPAAVVVPSEAVHWEGDCFVVPGQSVRLAGDGYHLFEVETVPFAETQPSPDGAFWRCKRPDGSRRCFFSPPPNT